MNSCAFQRQRKINVIGTSNIDFINKQVSEGLTVLLVKREKNQVRALMCHVIGAGGADVHQTPLG